MAADHAGESGGPAAEREGFRVHQREWTRLGIVLLLGLWWWWPGGLEFRSDDFLAIHYVQDWDRVWQDFVGPQYGALRVALFHRPLITLSIAVDAWIGGNGPFWPLLANVLVHLANTVLGYRLLRRFLPATPALAAVIFWCLHPCHTEAVHWMVGRVDTHATFFYLLSLLLYCRHVEGRSPLVLALLAFFLGCLTKELCLTIPAAIFVFQLGYGHRFDNRPLKGRFVGALRRLWPWTLVLALVLGMRLFVLGETLGGYEAAQFRIPAALRVSGMFFDFPEPGVKIALVGPALFLLLLAFALRGKLGRVLFAIALFVLAALPAGGSIAEQPQASARYYSLANLPLAGATALGGPLPPLLFLATQTAPAFAFHEESLALAEESARIQEMARELEPGWEPAFLPAPRDRGGRVLFAVGADRLGAPPFRETLRPVLPSTEMATGFVRPSPHLGGAALHYEGPGRLDGETLARIDRGQVQATLRLEATEASFLRVHVATVFGIATCILPNDDGGRVPLRDLFYAIPEGFDRPLSLLLWPATEIALDPRPRVYIEALDDAGNEIDAGHRSFPLPLTRDYGLPPKRPAIWLLVLALGFAVFLRFLPR